MPRSSCPSAEFQVYCFQNPVLNICLVGSEEGPRRSGNQRPASGGLVPHRGRLLRGVPGWAAQLWWLPCRGAPAEPGMLGFIPSLQHMQAQLRTRRPHATPLPQRNARHEQRNLLAGVLGLPAIPPGSAGAGGLRAVDSGLPDPPAGLSWSRIGSVLWDGVLRVLSGWPSWPWLLSAHCWCHLQCCLVR